MKRLYTILQEIQAHILPTKPKTPPTETKGGLWGLEDFSPNQMVDMVPESADVEKMNNLSEEFHQIAVSYLVGMQHKIGELLDNMKNPSAAEKLTKPWVQSKITLAVDYIGCVHDYLMFSREPADTEQQPDVADKIVEPDPEHLNDYTVTYPYNTMEAKDGLWDNIRKKREREGKNYKPAKTQKEGRPDSETWKELTKKKK